VIDESLVVPLLSLKLMLFFFGFNIGIVGSRLYLFFVDITGVPTTGAASMILPFSLTKPAPLVFAAIIIGMIWRIHMITSKTLIHDLSAAWALLSKSQHPVVASGCISFFLLPIFYNFTTGWSMVLVVTTFETEVFTASTFDEFVSIVFSFSAQIFATNLRAPLSVLVVIRVISVVPEHVLLMVVVLTFYNFNSFWKRWEQFHHDRVRNHYVTVFLRASLINNLRTILDFLFKELNPSISTKLMSTNKRKWFHFRIFFIKIITID
jgi:hypothetical protein